MGGADAGVRMDRLRMCVLSVASVGIIGEYALETW